jgi:cysteine-rich repeat protein
MSSLDRVALRPATLSPLALTAALAIALGAAAVLGGCPHKNNGVCGDGTVDTGEQCDDSNTVSGDGCSATCTTETTQCGNGVVDMGEQCDDGAANSNTAPDACRNDCTNAGCGDGVVDTGEMCDPPGANCNPDCTTGAFCGNNVVDAGEQCDDGNTATGDGCDAACALELQGIACNDSIMFDSSVGTSAVGTYDCLPFPDNGPEFVFSFTPTVSEQVVFTLNGPNPDNDLLVIADTGAGYVPGTCDATLVSVAGGPTNETVVLDAVAGTTYYVIVEGYTEDGSPGGPVTLAVLCASTATCGNGSVEPGEGCDDGNTTAGDGCDATCSFECNSPSGATACESIESDDTSVTGQTYMDTYGCFGFAEVGPENVYALTNSGASPEDVRVIMTGLTADMDIVVLDGGAAGTCDPSACVAASIGIGLVDEEVAFTIPAGSTYQVVVEGYDATGGPYDLSIGCGSTSVCGNSILSPAEECDDGNVAAGDGCEPTCLWGVLACSGSETDITANIDGSDVVGDTTGLADNYAGSCDGAGAPELVYALTPAADVDLRISAGTAGTNDVSLYVRDRNCTDGATELVCDNGGAADPLVGIQAVGGNTYWVFVDGEGTDSGSFLLHVETATCGDGVVDAFRGESCDDGNAVSGDGCEPDCTVPCNMAGTTSTCTSTPLMDDSTGNTNNVDFYNCVPWDEIGGEVWYLFDNDTGVDQTVTADLTGLTLDMDLFAITPGPNGSCNPNNCVTASDNAGTASESVTTTVAAGDQVFFVVDGYEGDGPYALSFSCM